MLFVPPTKHVFHTAASFLRSFTCTFVGRGGTNKIFRPAADSYGIITSNKGCHPSFSNYISYLSITKCSGSESIFGECFY